MRFGGDAAYASRFENDDAREEIVKMQRKNINEINPDRMKLSARREARLGPPPRLR